MNVAGTLPVTGRPAPAAYFELAGAAGAYPALDGLRAIAILLVLARHGVTALPPAMQAQLPAPLQWLYNLALNGWLGVDLFFVLSGFLIATHLLRWQHFSGTPYRLKAYLLKRICRTFPLYYAIIGLILLGLIPAYAPPAIDAGDILVLLTFMQDYYGTEVLVTLWSLAVEEKFYLLAPFLIFGLGRNRSTARIVTILLVLSLCVLALRTGLLLALPPSSYSDFFWRFRAPYSLEPFLFGVLCAFLVFSPRANQFAQRHAGAVALLATAVLLCIFCARPLVESGSWIASSLAIYAAAACFACIVFSSIVTVKAPRVVLGSAALRVVSRLSYALYLAHYTVLPAAALTAARLAGASAGAAYALIFVALYLAFSFGLAALLHFLVEKPFLILKERIA
jgi:peptidoglycan/LPS O-acetylase OafA/YrhL